MALHRHPARWNITTAWAHPARRNITTAWAHTKCNNHQHTQTSSTVLHRTQVIYKATDNIQSSSQKKFYSNSTLYIKRNKGLLLLHSCVWQIDAENYNLSAILYLFILCFSQQSLVAQRCITITPNSNQINRLTPYHNDLIQNPHRNSKSKNWRRKTRKDDWSGIQALVDASICTLFY